MLHAFQTVHQNLCRAWGLPIKAEKNQNETPFTDLVLYSGVHTGRLGLPELAERAEERIQPLDTATTSRLSLGSSGAWV